MRYLLMIYGDETTEAAASPEEDAALMAAYGAWVEAATKAGVMRGGERLRPTSAATVVRAPKGETLTTDGPYADTKEQLGGFFIVDCENLDDALQWASRIPAAADGTIEVRPIWEMD